MTNALLGCSAPVTITPVTTESPTPEPEASATPTLDPHHTPTPVEHFCDLPGSVRFTAAGRVVVPSTPGPSTDLTFLQLPVGFCAGYFTTVPNPRELKFAPSGELFVASPSRITAGGGFGRGAILVFPDDNQDGFGDTQITYLGGIAASHGLLFAGEYLYYQHDTAIMRVPYKYGDRRASGASEQVGKIEVYSSMIHWPKPLEMADDGTIYVGNGGDQGDLCEPANAFHGGILALDAAMPGGRPIAKGLRNPISIRCVPGHDRCYAIELSRDWSGAVGGREKIIPVREGDDWGYPCCATKDLPYPDSPAHADCSAVPPETNSFQIGDTPFDLDFEPGRWPEPWRHRAFVPLHGSFPLWIGARLVAIEMDPESGELRMGSNLPGEAAGGLRDFATGWDDGTRTHGRPASVVFSDDGRLFLGNDRNGDIIWIAPLDLRIPRAPEEPSQ
ncbi:MAG TPA: hypothetical protein VEB21_08845 [Terriglobales bacterium]|nr:hypothetical protein [Terriglobales bacterium]